MTHYYLRIDDLAMTAGSDEDFRWTGQSPQHLAEALQAALSQSDFISAWRDRQPESEEIAPDLFAIDSTARVQIEERAQQVHMEVSTQLAHRILAHRLNLLIGAHWKLVDVK